MMPFGNTTYLDCGLHLYVKMFGEFSIDIKDKGTFYNKGHLNRACLLIQYLLANRNSKISAEKIIDLMWEDKDNYSDPLNVVKNLVYRARNILRDALGDAGYELIVYSSNSYFWNNDIPCTIDIEEFEDYINKVSNSNISNENKIEYYTEALKLYSGDFLPNVTYADWAASTSLYYANRMHECLFKLCFLLIGEQRYEEIIEVCEKMLPYSLYEEKVHWYLCKAYIETDQNNKALKHYNYVRDLFYKKLGVTISQELRDLCMPLTKTPENSEEKDLTYIIKELKAVSEISGAFFCDYDVFKYMYCYHTHSLILPSQGIYLALITLNSKNNEVIPQSSLITAYNQIKSDILSNLRRNDTAVSYSSSQFIIMLTMTTKEIAEMVVTRIVNQFKKKYRRNDINVVVKINALEQ